MAYKECPTCKKYGWFDEWPMPEHACGPRWNCWTDDEAGPESTEEFRLDYASDAQAAAEQMAREMSDDGPWSGTIHVREWEGSSEQDQGPTHTFELEAYLEIQFNITVK